MSLRWFYRPSWRPLAEDPAVEFTDGVRLYTLDVTENAEEGSGSISQIPVDDPLGAYDFPPLTRIWAVETAISSTSNTYVYHGYIADRTVKRADSMRTGSARVWLINATDENSILSRRVLSSASANRPQESDVARVTWLANEADGQLLIDDTQFLFGAGAVTMDAADLRGQTALDVLNDCAEQSGKNFYAYFNQALGTGIWYGAQDHTAHQSMIRLTNDLDDVDMRTTFPITADAELNRDPSRLASGIYGTFGNGSTYVRNQSMFARIGLRDLPMSWPNVKTVGRAEARATRMLTDLSREEDRITCGVYLPAAKVTWIKAGMRLQFKATHMPGYEDFVWLRVLKCSVAYNSQETADASYLLTLELSTNDIPAEVLPDSFPASGILYLPAGDGGGGTGIEPEVRWQGTGDHPPSGGFPVVPLVGSLEYVSDGLLGTYPYKGFRALGNGSLTVTFVSGDVAGVVGTVTCTPKIVVNGAAVASSPHTTTDAAAPGFPYGHSTTWSFSTTVSVSSGDVISAQFTSNWTNMKVPEGTGQADYFLVSGDLT